MTFKNQLEAAIKEAGITAKELSERTGVPATTISGYRHGVTPNAINKKKLSDYLGIKEIQDKPPPSIEPVEQYTLQEAAQRLGVSVEFIKLALIHDDFRPQIGLAENFGKSYRYVIFKPKLEAWINQQ